MDNKISVVIPAYNKEKYINKTLDSVLAQTYSNIEIIIVDDGSKDNTSIILDEYAASHSKIKVIHKENGGVTSARIRGILESTGDWIGFVDSDDYVEPTMFERLINNALKYNADISHCGCVMVSSDGNNRTYYHNTGRLVLQNNLEALRDLTSGKVYEPSLCNKLYKKCLFENMIKNDLMDRSIKIYEDLLMNYYLFKEAVAFVFEDICLYHYISTDNSASKTKFTVDPLKVLKIIYADVCSDLKDTVYSRIIYQLINLSAMSIKEPIELRKHYRKLSRKELRKQIPKTIKSKMSIKIKIMALWTAVWPWSFGAFHRIYSKLKGTYSEYSLN